MCDVFFLNSWFASKMKSTFNSILWAFIWPVYCISHCLIGTFSNISVGPYIEILLVVLVVTASLSCFMSLFWDYGFVL
jgi:hypothetical protein